MATTLPLRLDSSFEQWWFVAPIDWAAANGHTEVVKELLRMDPSLFHNLTSKKRMHRLEKLWDDQDAFSDAAVGRSKVIKDLLQELHLDQSLPKNKVGGPLQNRVRRHYSHEQHIGHGLFKAGYGVWVLYIAAAAGDEGLVNQMITSNPEIIKGDGEFGLSDLLYAAARGQNVHIFQQILTLAKRVKAGHTNGKSRENGSMGAISPTISNGIDYVGLSYNNKTIQSKALLAAARAGNAEMVRELLKDSSTNATVLSLRDSNGTTALHAAAGRGHLEVVKLILELCPSSIRGQDGKGNTALHTAARRGCLMVATEIMRFEKDLIYTRNRHSETPLHLAVMGSKQPLSKLIMKQGGRIEVVKQLIACNNNTVPDYINWKTNEGHTPLHLSVLSARIDDKLVALLLQSPGINVLHTNNEGSTALDLARTCREMYPAAEFRCNIAISLLGAAISTGLASTTARSSTGPGSAAISVDLADPLLCSFSQDITIASDGESRASERRNIARRSVSVDWTTDFQTGGAATRLPMVTSPDALGGQLRETSVRPDVKTLTRNLASLRQTSAGIFQPRESPSHIASPSPVQCFSSLHSLVSGSTFRRSATLGGDANQVWAQTLQSKKWKNFRQRTSDKDGSPQSLRQQFSSTDNVLFHPNTPMERAELTQALVAPSISVSPFGSPSVSIEQSPTSSSPSYLKSWLKSVVVQSQSPSSSSGFLSPSKSSKRQRIKRRIKQIASLTHLSFSSASETHSFHDHGDNAHFPGSELIDDVSFSVMQSHGAGIDDISLPMIDHRLSTVSRGSSVQSCMACHRQCFCLDHLFQRTQNSVAPQIKEGQPITSMVVNKANGATPSLEPDATGNDIHSTRSSRSPLTLDSWSSVDQRNTHRKSYRPQGPEAAITRSGSGSSPEGSRRPSVTLSLSPWLSPTLRAVRKHEMVGSHAYAPVPTAPKDDHESESSPPNVAGHRPKSNADGDDAASPAKPLALDSPLHERSALYRRTGSHSRQDSLRFCVCAPCFQDRDQPDEEEDSNRAARVKLYFT